MFSNFTAGNQGKKRIEDIQVGDQVLYKDDQPGKLAYNKVVKLFEHKVTKIYQVKVGKETIESTDEHPYWVDGKGWTGAKDLQAGDLVVTSEGKKLPVISVTAVQKEVIVYNFEVENTHTYFVSDTGIWVHNSCLKWSSSTVNQASRDLDRGVKEVHVNTRSEAEELYLGKFHGDGYKNTSGMKPGDAFDLVDYLEQTGNEYAGTYHWDDEFDSKGVLKNHNKDNPHGYTPHLQIHPNKGKVIRIFFKKF